MIGGVIHLPALRPALVRMGLFQAKPGASCPFGYSAAGSVAELKAREARSHAARRGSVPAKSTYALGFRLDVDRLRDLQSWAARAGAHCKTEHGGQLLSCEELAANALPLAGGLTVRSIWFELGSRGTLSSVKVLREDPAAQPVAAAFETMAAEVTAHAGAPTQLTGSSSPSALAAGSLRQAGAVYRYADYYAVLRATNMGGHYLLTEEYSSLVDG